MHENAENVSCFQWTKEYNFKCPNNKIEFWLTQSRVFSSLKHCFHIIKINVFVLEGKLEFHRVEKALNHGLYISISTYTAHEQMALAYEYFKYIYVLFASAHSLT